MAIYFFVLFCFCIFLESSIASRLESSSRAQGLVLKPSLWGQDLATFCEPLCHLRSVLPSDFHNVFVPSICCSGGPQQFLSLIVMEWSPDPEPFIIARALNGCDQGLSWSLAGSLGLTPNQLWAEYSLIPFLIHKYITDKQHGNAWDTNPAFPDVVWNVFF